MRSYASFRRHTSGVVVARSNEDRHPLQVVPFGRYGAGVWTGHPIELLVVVGMLLIGLIGIPEWRWFFGATVLVGSAIGYFLWRRNQKITAALPVGRPASAFSKTLAQAASAASCATTKK